MIVRFWAAFLCCIGLAALDGASTTDAAAPTPAGSWIGSYTLAAADQIAVSLAGDRATVALGPGHAAVQTVRATRQGARVRFSVPGRPAVLFDGRLEQGRLGGTVRQSALRGRFSLRRGAAPGLIARGFYDRGGRLVAVVDDEYANLRRLVDPESGELRGLYPVGTRFEIGAGAATREPVLGDATFDAAGATLPAGRVPRIRLRQLEVRFRSGAVMLAGTLTLPAGPRPHPAVAYVHGSGTTKRSYLTEYQALLLASGVAVLTYDKRGVGQSGGSFPGELATDRTIGILAGDAQAAARFLAAQPEIDRARVGLIGHSQGGWIVPLAASREPAVRFIVAFAGPITTQGETDQYYRLSGSGTMSEAEVIAEVRRTGPTGFDPMPAIRALRIPGLWLFGGSDKVVPTNLCLERIGPLVRETGRDFTTAVFEGGNHAIVVPRAGSTPDRLAPGLLATLRDWLRARRLA